MTQPKPWANLVDAFRQEAELSGDAVEAGWRQMEGRVRAGEIPPLEAAPATGLGLKLVLATVLVGGVATAAWAGRPSSALSPTVPALQSVSVAQPSTPPTAPAAIPVEPAVDRETETRPPEVLPAPSTSPRPKSPRRPAKVDRSPIADVDEATSLAEELAALQRARAALRFGDPKRAQALVASHRTRYPDSTFEQERQLTEIAALCAQGRSDAAQRKAATFRTRFPGSTRDAGALGKCGDIESDAKKAD